MQPRKRALALALLAALLPAAASAEEEVVAKLVRHQPQVVATPPGSAISPITGIRKGAQVRTGEKAGALIAVGLQPPVRGMMKMGPESRVTFKQWLIEAATRGEIGFFVQLGNVLFAFTPPKPSDIQVEPGVDRWIETPTVRRIRLHGTEVFVRVAPDGATSVFVVEGSATVEAETGRVELSRGQWTLVRPGKDPTRPAPADPTSALLALPSWPGEPSQGDPPLFNLQDLRLDLPKVDRR